MKTKILFKKTFLEKFFQGIELATKAVSVTYGPNGKNVFLNRPAGLLITKDGVTVARELSHPDPSINAGLSLVKEACIEVNKSCGDGTTTATVLISAFSQVLKKSLASNKEKEFQKELAFLKKHSNSLVEKFTNKDPSSEQLERLAYLSSNHDQTIASSVLDSLTRAGSYGHIQVVESKKIGIHVTSQEGFFLDEGVHHSEFLCEGVEDPIMALFTEGLSSYKDIAPCLEEASRFLPRPLIIITPYIIGEALSTILINKRENDLPVYVTGIPNYHLLNQETYFSLEALTGCQTVRMGESFDIEWFGGLSKAILKENSATLYAAYDAENRIIQRIKQLEHKIEVTQEKWIKEKLSVQKALLSGGLVNLEVKYVTDSETREVKGRLEDTLSSLRGAVEEGLVPGGGNSYAFLGYLLREKCPLSHRALFEPLGRIAGEDSSIYHNYCLLQNKGLSPWEGFDLNCKQSFHLENELSLYESAKTLKVVIEKVCSLLAEISKMEVFIERIRE